jgi:hypothetical protein
MPPSNQSSSEHSRQRDPMLAPSTIESMEAELETARKTISLIAWKRRRPEFDAIDDGLWLMNVYLELKSAGFGVTLVSACDDPFANNEPFHDVELSPLPPRFQR